MSFVIVPDGPLPRGFQCTFFLTPLYHRWLRASAAQLVGVALTGDVDGDRAALSALDSAHPGARLFLTHGTRDSAITPHNVRRLLRFVRYFRAAAAATQVPPAWLVAPLTCGDVRAILDAYRRDLLVCARHGLRARFYTLPCAEALF